MQGCYPHRESPSSPRKIVHALSEPNHFKKCCLRFRNWITFRPCTLFVCDRGGFAQPALCRRHRARMISPNSASRIKILARSTKVPPGRGPLDVDKVCGLAPWGAYSASRRLCSSSSISFANLIESRRIGCCPRQSAALFELPFELFSVALLIHDGTLLFMRRRNRSITETTCRPNIFPRFPPQDRV
jgi:hypothetical protein